MSPVTSPLLSGSRRFRRAAKRAAFSLIEVVLAVGVIAFAFVAILGLLPAGMTQFRQAIDTSVCAQIAQRVINEVQQTDFNVLVDEKATSSMGNDYAFRMPTVVATNGSTTTNPGKCVRYFDEQGNEVLPAATTSNTLTEAEKARVVYMVNVRVIPKTSMPARTPTYVSHLATLTIQVAYNPSAKPITLSSANPASTDSTRRLWTKTAGITVINYNAQIARN